MARKVLVCGGRDYADANAVYYVLCTIQPTEIIEGGARGADSLAREWAHTFGVPCTTVRADWQRHGRGAGPIRNQKMLDEHKPDLVVAFPGGAGTADMVRRSKAQGFEVLHAP